MRVLVVAIGPLAASGYATRINSMLAAYSERGWMVDLLHLAQRDENDVSSDLLANLAAYIPVTLAPPRWTDHLSLLPPAAARVVSARASNSLRASYDLAQAESGAAWALVRHTTAAKRLTVLHDDDAARLRRLARGAGNPIRKAARIATSIKYARLQRSLVRDADRTWFVSAVERDRVDPNHTNSLLVPNGAESGFFRTNASPVTEPVTMFVGPAAYDANRQAVEYYVSSIFPLIRDAVPNAQLWLVGRGWSDLARREAGVVDRGFVAELPQELTRAAVVVAPLLAGSGTKIKVIEAMASARPVVVSTVAAEAIAPSTGLRVHDDPRSFATAVAALLQDTNARRADGEANRLAVSSLEWSSIWARAIADIARLVTASRDSATLDQ
jgi:glycosyltransferase involved in cell wall biosynthesis